MYAPNTWLIGSFTNVITHFGTLPDSRLESDSNRQHVEQGTEIAKNSSNTLKET